MTKDEALKLALEALEDYVEEYGPHEKDSGAAYAITAIKEALAQPEQEPVVWMYQDKTSHAVKFQRHMSDFVDHSRFYETPLYTTPLQRTWVGLTDSEFSAIYDSSATTAEKMELVEAKLEEKNCL